MRCLLVLVGVWCLGLVEQSVVAAPPAPPPDYGFDFVTVGAPGNAPASPTEFPLLGDYGAIGAVNYTYRISRTETTLSQWYEFVVAYAPFLHGSPDDPHFNGGVSNSSIDPAHPVFSYNHALASYPNVMGWQFAARFCNWLSNGKTNAAWAFETGAYDTSSWVHLPGGAITGNFDRSPDAKYWIPSLDEWTKAMHYDPNKNGPGVGGYWLYPLTQDTPPVGGWPSTPGAQTLAGEWPGKPSDIGAGLPVGSYPAAISPWGLLDGSGGVSEWLGILKGAEGATNIRGSPSTSLFPSYDDRLDAVGAGGLFDLGLNGFRLASSVPAPDSVLVLFAFFPLTRRR